MNHDEKKLVRFSPSARPTSEMTKDEQKIEAVANEIGGLIGLLIAQDLDARGVDIRDEVETIATLCGAATEVASKAIVDCYDDIERGEFDPRLADRMRADVCRQAVEKSVKAAVDGYLRYRA